MNNTYRKFFNDYFRKKPFFFKYKRKEENFFKGFEYFKFSSLPKNNIYKIIIDELGSYKKENLEESSVFTSFNI